MEQVTTTQKLRLTVCLEVLNEIIEADVKRLFESVYPANLLTYAPENVQYQALYMVWRNICIMVQGTRVVNAYPPQIHSGLGLQTLNAQSGPGHQLKPAPLSGTASFQLSQPEGFQDWNPTYGINKVLEAPTVFVDVQPQIQIKVEGQWECRVDDSEELQSASYEASSMKQEESLPTIDASNSEREQFMGMFFKEDQQLENSESGNQSLKANEDDAGEQTSKDNKKKKKKRMYKLQSSQQISKHEESVSCSSKRQERQISKMLTEFLQASNQDINYLTGYSLQQLDSVISKFWFAIQKENESEYHASSFRTYRSALRRIFKRNDNGPIANCDIQSSTDFPKSTSAFQSVLKQLQALGKTIINHKKPITEKHLQMIYDSEILSVQTPAGLMNKVLFDVMLFTGRRGRENLTELTTEHIEEGVDEQDRKYFFFKIADKTKNQGTKVDDGTPTQGRIYEMGGKLCPYASLTKYIRKRSGLQTKRLFVKAKDNWSEQMECWYTEQPVGKNILSSFMTRTSKDLGILPAYTNHSIRTTKITSLISAGHSALSVIAVTPNTNVESPKSYHEEVNDDKAHFMA